MVSNADVPAAPRRARWWSGLVLAVLASAVAAGEPVLPGTDYDPAIPPLHAVVGHGFGEDITAPADLTRYLEALAAAARSAPGWWSTPGAGRAGRCTIW